MRWMGLSLLLMITACGHSSTILPGSQDTLPPKNQNGAANANTNLSNSGCPAFRSSSTLGTVTSDQINEASGIVASRNNSDIFWVHNDSGDDPRVFALNRNGRLVAIYTLAGASVQDWEDIAIGPGPNAAQDYLFIGDTGSAGSLPVTIYRFVEPAVQADQTLVEATMSDFIRIDLVYPDEADYDAETLWVDPAAGDIYIVTKTGRESFLFRKNAPHQDGATSTLALAATIDFSISPNNRSTTGGDIAAAGDLIVIRTYSHAFIWTVPANGTLPQAFDSQPCLTLDLEEEPQGEAIAFTPEGNLVTLSERRHQPIYLYERE